MNKIEKRREEILKLNSQGKAQKEIAEILGVSNATISKDIKKMTEQGYIIKKQGKIEKRREKILELNSQGKTQKEISEILGVSVDTVRRDVRVLKNRKYDVKKQTPKVKIIGKIEKRRKKVLELYKEGKNKKEIAEVLEVSIDTIRIDFKSLNISEEKRKPKIKKTKQQKIKERRQRVVELNKQGKTQAEIAKILNVSRYTILDDVKALEEQGKVMKKQKPRRKGEQKRKNDDSTIIIKLCENFYGQPKILKKFDRYIRACKEKFEEGNLKSEEIETIRKVVSLTNKYGHVVFFIRLSIKYGNLKDAMFMINNNMYNEEYSKEQREKLSKMKTQIRIVQQKRLAIRTLRRGLGVKQAIIDSGLSETEVVKLNKLLISKKNETKEKSKEEEEE